MWPSRTCEPYMSGTVHFTENWEMKTACLQTGYFPHDQTGDSTKLFPGRFNELCALIQHYPGLIGDIPSQTHLIQHDIDIGDAQPICQRNSHPQAGRLNVCLLKNLTWVLDSAPIFYFCKVNAITKPDAFPVPQVEDCVDQVGAAQVSKFNLLKGYWQVPLTERVKKHFSPYYAIGFVFVHGDELRTPEHPVTFQRLMCKVVSGMEGCRVYLRWVTLTINLSKCEFAKPQSPTLTE